MKFSTGTIFYNDVVGLTRQLPTLQDFDYNIFIDGSWPDWGTSDLSNDGSRAVISSYPKSKIIDMPQRMPRDKYEMLLRECERLGVTYLVILDSDEYIKQPFDFEKFKEECVNHPKVLDAMNFKVKMEYWDSGKWHTHYPHYRVFYNPVFINYGERHNQIRFGEIELSSNLSGDIKSLVFMHDKRYKTQEYIDARRDWNLKHPNH